MSGNDRKSLGDLNVATLERQDSSNLAEGSARRAPSNLSLTIDNVSIKIPKRPQLNLRASNEDFTHLIKVGHAGPEDFDLPKQQASGNDIMTSRNPKKNLNRIIGTCTWQIVNGFSDAAPGALLPFMEKAYDLNYSTASLIWMANAAGFITVACLAHKIEPILGKEKSISVGICCTIVMYALVASGTKFPVIVAAFYIGGFGLANVLSQCNVFLARLDRASKYLSISHGCYGVGATVSPLVATAMVSGGVKWHYFYLILLGLMLLNLGYLSWGFAGADTDLKRWDADQEHDVVRESDIASSEDAIELGILNDNGTATRAVKDSQTLSHKATMLLALKLPTTWILAFFILFYQGAEVSMGGWIVTYLLDYKHGNIDSVGYVASGFWGGMTFGRLFLTRPLHKHFGARRSVIVISLLAILFIVLAWVVPSIIASGVFVSLGGVFIGPNYPLLITTVPSLIPRRIQIVSLTIVTAFGSSGGALFPFIIGLISQSAGAYVVLPGFIAMYSAMVLLWISLPNIDRTLKHGQTPTNFLQRIW